MNDSLILKMYKPDCYNKEKNKILETHGKQEYDVSIN